MEDIELLFQISNLFSLFVENAHRSRTLQAWKVRKFSVQTRDLVEQRNIVELAKFWG